MKISLYIVLITFCIGCTSKYAKNIRANTQYTIQEAEILKWDIHNSRTFTIDSPIDTFTLRYNIMGNLEQHIVTYLDGGKLITDSISYNNSKSDSLPDWQVFTKNESTFILKYSAVHDFDSTGNVTKELLIYKDTPTFNKTKIHHYDSEMNPLGYTVYNHTNTATEKVFIHSDTVNNVEIVQKQRFERSGKLISTSIDSNFLKNDTTVKQKKWTDWENRKYYNNLPKCYICETTYHYDDKGRIVKKDIISKEGKGKAELQYYYNKSGKLVSKTEIVNRDTTKYTYFREYDNQGNYISFKEYKNEVLTNYLRRKLKYWN